MGLQAAPGVLGAPGAARKLRGPRDLLLLSAGVLAVRSGVALTVVLGALVD
jgi:hypothetical protein